MFLDKFKAETTTCDFKVALETKKSKSWLKSVSAFANTIGGMLIFGVDDERNIVGVKDAKGDSEIISRLIKDRITPTIIPELSTYTIDGKDIIVLEIKAGKNTPYYYRSDSGREAYIRSGSESQIAPTNILNELIMKGSKLSFDAQDSLQKKADYSFTLFSATYRERTGLPLEDNDLISFGLSDRSGYLTNAGCLLADQHIIYNSKVVCTRWNGLVKGSIFDDALDDKEYEGNLIYLLQSSYDFVKNNSKVRFEKKGSYRIDKPDYAERAVTEALVNALIHRDYNILGSEIHIDMYDDRLEIYSPGGMFQGEKIQDLSLAEIYSTRRNPIIADIFQRMKYMEKRGSGIRKIFDTTSRLPGYDDDKRPSFYSTPSAFYVTLKNLNYTPDKDAVSDVHSVYFLGIKQNPRLCEALSKLDVNSVRKVNIKKLYDVFGSRVCFGRKEIIKETGITASPASDLIRKMLTAGLIVQVKDQGRGQYQFTIHA